MNTNAIALSRCLKASAMKMVHLSLTLRFLRLTGLVMRNLADLLQNLHTL